MASRVDVKKFFRDRMEKRRLEEEKIKQRQKDIEEAKEAYYKFCREMVRNAVKQAETTDTNPDVPWYLKNLMNRQKTKPEYHIDVDPLTFYCGLRKAWEKHYYMRNVDKRTVLPPPDNFPEYQRMTFTLPRYTPQNGGTGDNPAKATNKKPSLAVPCFRDVTKVTSMLDTRKDKLKEIINRILEDGSLLPNSTLNISFSKREQIDKIDAYPRQMCMAAMMIPTKESHQILRAFAAKLQSLQDDMQDSVISWEPEPLTDPVTQRKTNKYDLTAEAKDEPTAPGKTAITSPETPVQHTAVKACTTSLNIELTDVTIAGTEKTNDSVPACDVMGSKLNRQLMTTFCNVSVDRSTTSVPWTSIQPSSQSSENPELLPALNLHATNLSARTVRRISPKTSPISFVPIHVNIVEHPTGKTLGFLNRVKSRLSHIRRRLFPGCCRSSATD